MPEPSAAWTIADRLDFEQLLATPLPAGDDLRLYEQEIAPRLSRAAQERRGAVFRAWLEARRRRFDGPLAGRAYDVGYRLVRVAAIALGFAIGAGLAGTLLGGGSEPVNALLFLLWTVGLQWLLLAAMAGAWLLRRAGFEFAPLRHLVAHALAGAGALLRRLPGERRDALRAALARLARRGRAGRAGIGWPPLILLQTFGLAFNAGILAAMLLVHLPFVELRFGWQSTYELSAEEVQRAVQALATPWRAFAPGLQPSLEDIRATRYARGAGAAALPSHAARAWWPFLALCVACYGLLVRAALLVVGTAALRWRLRTLGFDDPDSNALWRRLHGPLVSGQGGGAVLPAAVERSPHGGRTPAIADCQALLSEEMSIGEERLAVLLRERLGWRLRALARVSIDDREAVEPALAMLAAAADARSAAPDAAAGSAMPDAADDARSAALAVVVPGSRDPIVAIARFLQEAARQAGGEVVVVLCGGAACEGPVDAARTAVWQRFLDIHRLEVGLECLP
jgi:hypothetical protein